MGLAKFLFYSFLLISLPVISGKLLEYDTAKKSTPEKVHVQNDTIITREYSSIKDSVKILRENLLAEYKKAATEAERTSVLLQAEDIFTSALINDIIPAWYGTPWEFYGTTEVPNKGTIACGYFVTTTMRDAGVKLDRIHLAEIASETMIRTVIDKKYITRYRNTPWRDFIAAVKNKGDGLYMIGLDFHTGFALCSVGEVYFIHANLPGVMQEVGESSYLLCWSNYRVTGRLSNNPEFIKKWLLGETFKNLEVQN